MTCETAEGKRDRVRTAYVRVTAIAVALMLLAPIAYADHIDDLIAQLSDSSDRVRISAVLALTNQESPRAIGALTQTLLKTSETKNIRGLAASALGKIIANGKPSESQRKRAVDALNVAKRDREPFVSAKAEAALAQLGSIGTNSTGGSMGGSMGGSTSGSTSGSGVYVQIGPMSSKTRSTDDKKFQALMVRTAGATLAKVATAMKTTWPGGPPTKAALDKQGVLGFYVDGTLNELKVDSSGGLARISCKVSMLLASFPDPTVIGMLSGGAAVTASGSASEVALARQDCVQAVVEDLIAKKIVPTIKSKLSP